MDYKESRVESYMLDENGSIHRVNVLHLENGEVFTIPINQITTSKEKDVFSSLDEAIYKSIVFKGIGGNHSPRIRNHENYEKIKEQVKNDYPELLLV